METSEILFHVGSASMILVGVGHTLGELTSGKQTLPDEVEQVIASMKITEVQMPGRKVALFDMMRGFSFMMGAALIVLGVLNHLIASFAVQSTWILIVNIAFAAFSVAISVRYFFIFPVVFMAITTVCYLGALIL